MATRAQPHVLVVDDYPELAANLAEILEDIGCAVTTAGDSRAALAALERWAFSVAIVDLRLGADNGFALIECLSHEAPTLPLIVKALYDDEVDRARALHCGRVESVLEPICFETLCALVDELARDPAAALSLGEASTGRAGTPADPR